MFIGNLFLITYGNYVEQVVAGATDFLLLDGENFELLSNDEFNLLGS